MPATSTTALQPSGSEIRAAREALGLTRAELAVAAEASEQSVVRWELGHSRPRQTAMRRVVATLWPESGAA